MVGALASDGKAEQVPTLLCPGDWEDCYLKHFDVWVFTLDV